MTGDYVMLTQTDVGENHHKFYELRLDGDQVHARWGRVGADGQRQTYRGGYDMFQRKLNEKLRKGYQKLDIATADGTIGANARLRKVSHRGLAAEGFEGDPRLTAVVDRLVSVNAHQISDQSGGKLNVVGNQVTTPLGLLTANTLHQAERVLAELVRENNWALRRVLLEQYLMLVPQKVGARAGWEDGWLRNELHRQPEFLRQLRDSLDFAAAQAASDTDDGPNPFRVRLAPVEDTDPRFKQVSTLFTGSKNDVHPSSRLHLAALFAVTSPIDDPAFEETAAKLGNVQQLWHGTSASNVLSIFAKGLVVPRQASHGRMYGSGVYHSESSTKSLNYSHGVWDGRRESSCFMLLNDVALGWEYRPSVHGVLSMSGYDQVRTMTDPKTGRPFNSINVRGGTAGVRNHEAIVWDRTQYTIRYLCQFEH